ncbi:MAG: hypothetical protein AAFU78_20255 [Cyanobacteria bacterium J06633_2]
MGQFTWYPAFPDLRVSLVIYSVYWILVSGLQSLLLRRVQEPSLAVKWFWTTAITGLSLMLAHDLLLLDILGINTGGQGILLLIISLPALAISGGLVLGFTQFRLIRNLHPNHQRNRQLRPNWFLASWVSWGLSFLCLFFGGYGAPLTLIFLALIGTTLKGIFLAKYLRL